MKKYLLILFCALFSACKDEYKEPVVLPYAVNMYDHDMSMSDSDTTHFSVDCDRILDVCNDDCLGYYMHYKDKSVFNTDTLPGFESDRYITIYVDDFAFLAFIELIEIRNDCDDPQMSFDIGEMIYNSFVIVQSKKQPNGKYCYRLEYEPMPDSVAQGNIPPSGKAQ